MKRALSISILGIALTTVVACSSSDDSDNDTQSGSGNENTPTFLYPEGSFNARLSKNGSEYKDISKLDGDVTRVEVSAEHHTLSRMNIWVTGDSFSFRLIARDIVLEDGKPIGNNTEFRLADITDFRELTLSDVTASGSDTYGYSTIGSAYENAIDVTALNVSISNAINSSYPQERGDQLEATFDIAFTSATDSFKLNGTFNLVDDPANGVNVTALGQGTSEYQPINPPTDNDDEDSSGDGGTLNCDAVWSGPSDVQLSSFCQTACLYKQQGFEQGVTTSCDQLKYAFNTDYSSSCSVCP